MSEGIRDTAATTRSQSVVHILQRNPVDAMRLIGAVLDRPAGSGSPDILIVAPNADDAAALAGARADSVADDARLMTPVTAVARGRHLLAQAPSVIVGAPSELVPLVRESVLRLAEVGTMVLVWPEEILAGEQLPALESLVAEVPRTAERIAVVAHPDKPTDELLDRVMFKARRVEHGTPRGSSPVLLQYVVVAPERGLGAVRAMVDGLNPTTTTLVTFTDASEAAARSAVRSLGNPVSVGVSRGVPEARSSLAILFFDVPAPADLQRIGDNADAVLAVVDASHVEALRAAAAGGATPFTWTTGLASARSALDTLRDSLRGAVANGTHTPWMPVLEPLLAELDPAEVAAAAVALLDREYRKERARRAAEKTAAPAPREAAGERRGGPAGRSGPPGKDRRGDRPAGGRFERDRPAGGRFGREGDRGGPRRDRDDRPRGPRRDAPDRVPRAARESAEWAERGERLRNARRPRPGKRES